MGSLRLRPPVLLPLLAALLLLPGLTLAAHQARSDTGKLTSLRATGSKRFSSEQVIAVSGLHMGDTVHREDFQAAADRLSATGLFAGVHYRFRSQGENVGLEFEIEDAPTVPVSFDNLPWLTDGEIASALRASLGLFDGTAPQQGAYVDAMAQALTQLLESRGVQATVEHSLIVRPDADGMMQQFRAIGPSLNIEAVEFSDALANQDHRVQDRLTDLVGKPFSRYAVQVFDAEQVRPIYLAQGRLNVKFGLPQAWFTGDPRGPLPNHVRVTVPIEPGPVYRFHGVDWIGNATLKPAELDPLLGLREGDPADGMKILGAWDRVRAQFGSHGYLDATLDPQPIYDNAAGRVSFRVTVTEGPQYRMGELVVTGLSLEAEKRLREAWKIEPGAVFDQAYFEAFRTHIAAQAFGDLPVHYDQLGHWLRTNPQAKTVDVLLDFH